MANVRKLVTGTVVAALALVAAAWFLLISPKNAQAADIQAQATEEASGHTSLKQQLAMLTEDEKHAVSFAKQLTELQRHMPDDTSEPALIREIYKAADKSGVDLSDVTPGAPIASLTPPPAAKPTPTSTSSTSSSASSTADAEAAPAPKPKAAVGLSQIPITMTVTGTYTQIKDFLDRVSKFQRAFLVSGVSLTIAQPVAPPADASGVAATGPSYSGDLSVTVTGAVFSVGSPLTVGETESTPTAQPSPSTTPSPAKRTK
ncbi:MAG: hypothetical protein JWM93_1391 [Frankiales bacterium]|nr:hypothetical protein [Frankiales bacterium]